MRTLHVAALPFPTPQGTQGLIHAMLSALAAHGHEAHLLCYAHGAGAEPSTYAVHRAPGAARGSLRSGPSLAKLWRDVGLARALHTLTRRLRPDAIVAHHVEAAACALTLRPHRARAALPLLFVAHTSLRAELPSYLPGALCSVAQRAGEALDVALVRGAKRTLAVSPLLATLLAEAAGRTVHTLPLPWCVPAPMRAQERAAARRRLGIAPAARVLLYAGNLDRYQGLAPMLAGVARMATPVHLLIATCAPQAALARELASHRLGPVTFASLADEAGRRRVHAAADLALVPRRSPGGIPIKLLDALARGVPTVAARLALAGLPLAACCEVVETDLPERWCASITHALAELRPDRVAAVRAYLAEAHAPARFATCLEAHVHALREPS